MNPHTTHFDDCGCLTEKLNEARLRAQAAEDVAITSKAGRWSPKVVRKEIERRVAELREKKLPGDEK